MQIVMSNRRTEFYFGDGYKATFHHNPPRHWKDVLTDFGRMMEEREKAKEVLRSPDPAVEVHEWEHNWMPPLAFGQLTQPYGLGEEAWKAIEQKFGQHQDTQQPGATDTPKRSREQESPTRSLRLMQANEAQNVLNNPLLRLPGTTGDGIGRGIRTATSAAGECTSKPSLGQYTDFRVQPRKLPHLNRESVFGILRQPGALDDTTLDETVLTRIANEATAYRLRQGVGGPNICAESAELYIRVFRALGLTASTLTELDAEQLERMYLAYLVLHTG